MSPGTSAPEDWASTPVFAPETVHVIASAEEALEVAREFAAEIRPGAAERDAQGTRPWEQIRSLRGSGLLGITVPAEYGGADVDIVTLVEIFRIISAADPAVGQIPQNHFSHLENVHRLGTPEQRRFFYTKILGGALFGNALSERGTAGGLRNLKTRLEPKGPGEYVLSGRKYYSTGALFAQWIPVTCLDDDGRLQVAHVPRDAPGVEVVDDWDVMGQRGTASGTTVLDRVTVPEEHVIPIWRYAEGPSIRLAFGQVMHIAIDVGIAEEALADTVAYVGTRSRAWHAAVPPIARAGDDPHIIRRVGELTVQVKGAHALMLRAAEALDRCGDSPTEEDAREASLAVATAKAAASAAAVQVASDMFALTGASATDERWNLHRHWRNARTHTLHDPEVWKYHHIGDWVLNRRLPPDGALF
ncbi:SfnB family sulfur acquisition oxidoreductase [Spirillospora sp. CA-108201]